MRRKKAIPTAIRLSHQEVAVLVLLWDGFQIKGVAEQMGLSPRTVKNYKANIYTKLEVQTQLQMARKALEIGLLQVPELGRGLRRDMEVPG